VRFLNAVATENVGYRQWLVWVRFVATFTVRKQRGQWGVMVRRKIG